MNLLRCTCNDGVMIRSVEVRFAIEKLALNKSCCPNQITAEHLKHACQRILVLLALCFTGLLIHGVLPESMLSVLLVPVIKDKMGKISSIENYRPIALMTAVVEGTFQGPVYGGAPL